MVLVVMLPVAALGSSSGLKVGSVFERYKPSTVADSKSQVPHAGLPPGPGQANVRPTQVFLHSSEPLPSVSVHTEVAFGWEQSSQLVPQCRASLSA
jgi:hypothetical protein